GVFSYDVGRMNDQYFNYVAAFGAFAEISYDTKQEWKNVLGYAAYFLNAVGELYQNIHYSHHIVIETPEGREEGDYVFGAVCNSISVGGMPLFGKADVRLNDGKMELLLIKAPKNLIELQAVVSTLRKGHSDHPSISFMQIATSVTFDSEKEVAWTLDGEFGGSFKHSKISVIDHAISVMTMA
ncbi:MAG: diacylglycerol kinase family lipid kinase, partial [Lachnospiraceae bacterium]|nr:diacylglycerol kinase family lipid kinase [Lachnospiraceae bacterium]